MNDTKLIPMTTLSKTVVSLLKVHIGLTIIAVFAGVFEYYNYSTASEFVDVTQDMLVSDWTTMVVGFSQTLLFIVLGIAFLKWIYRINKNLNTLSNGSLEFTPGWSIGWYFIPIACWYKPFQVMKEIYLACKDDPQADTGLLGRWWFLWIVSTFAANIAMRMAFGSEGPDSMLASTIAYIVSDAIDVLLAFVALKLVTEIWISYESNLMEQDSAINSDTPLRGASS